MSPGNQIFSTLNAKLFQMNSLCKLLHRKNKALKEEIVILRARKNFYKKLVKELERDGKKRDI